jgi:histidinol-phosphate aminotransferase
MPQFSKLLHPLVAKIKPYLPGKSIREIEQKYGIHEVIKLASNENAWGCSPKVIEHLKHVNAQDISIYPNTYLHPCFQSLKEMLDIPGESLFISNGSDAIFSLLMQAFALPEHKSILSHQYAFMGYRTQAQSFGLDCLEVPVEPSTWRFKIQDMVAQINKKTAIIFLANPNNPTGVLMSWDELRILLDQTPNETLVVIDEAYYEYVEDEHPPILELIASYPHLIITRTLSKAYGLAGLRLGYAIAHPEIIQILKNIQLPFTVNQMALNAGQIALGDQLFIQRTQKKTQDEKQKLIKELSQLPLEIRPTHGNFLTLGLEEDVSNLVHTLEEEGTIVRPLHAFGLNHYLRITIGQEVQNNILINQLKHYFHS